MIVVNIVLQLRIIKHVITTAFQVCCELYPECYWLGPGPHGPLCPCRHHLESGDNRLGRDNAFVLNLPREPPVVAQIRSSVSRPKLGRSA